MSRSVMCGIAQETIVNLPRVARDSQAFLHCTAMCAHAEGLRLPLPRGVLGSLQYGAQERAGEQTAQ